MIVTQMIREPDYKVTDPKFDDICVLMIRVTQDEGEPLITLRKTSVESGTDCRSELWIARLNVCDNGGFAGWLVRYKSGYNQESLVLATGSPVDDVFHRYELFGVLQDLRQVCLVPVTIVYEAIQWYLPTGVQHPSLTWLDLRDCLRTA
jgi:hypothetical protein